MALATVSAILDTLGDDDFVNVIGIAESPQPLVGCFHDKLVRATPDNRKELKLAVENMECTSSVNFTAGLEMGFQMLHHVSLEICQTLSNFILVSFCSTTNLAKEVNAIRR